MKRGYVIDASKLLVEATADKGKLKFQVRK